MWGKESLRRSRPASAGHARRRLRARAPEAAVPVALRGGAPLAVPDAAPPAVPDLVDRPRLAGIVVAVIPGEIVFYTAPWHPAALAGAVEP